MATATYTPLANITLTSSAATVTFSSISQAYKDLILVIAGTPTSGQQYFYTYFNSDTGANYSRFEAYGTGSSPAAGSSSNLIPITLDVGNVASTILNFMDYSATDKHKTVLYRQNVVNELTLMGAGRWANTAAVTSIAVTGYSSGQMAAGTTLALYGVAA